MLNHCYASVYVELSELKKKMEEFEVKNSQVEKESETKIKEVEEAWLKSVQLQDGKWLRKIAPRLLSYFSSCTSG